MHGLIRSGRMTRVYQSPMARPTGSGDRDAESEHAAAWSRPGLGLDCGDAPQIGSGVWTLGMVRRISVLHKN
jgi:hypothetical protein